MTEKQVLDTSPVEEQFTSDGKLEASNISALYIDPAKEAKLLAKLDIFFVPVIMLVYLSCFLDRSNIGEFHTTFISRYHAQINHRQCKGCWYACRYWSFN